ncbi:MAG: hypothetical protein PHQ28_05330 [Mycobacterium sp.]|nr:hypothetical protein [Mycobacterium sp.]
MAGGEVADDAFGRPTYTRPEQLDKVVKPGSGGIAKQRAQLLDRIVKVLDTRLHNGGAPSSCWDFSHLAAKFQTCVFKPESTLNDKRNAETGRVRGRIAGVVRRVEPSASGRALAELLSNSIAVCSATFQDPSCTSFIPVIARTLGCCAALSMTMMSSLPVTMIW